MKLKFISNLSKLVILSLVFQSCASSNIDPNQYVNIDEKINRFLILERADDLKEKPKWASITDPLTEDAKNYYFLGYVEVDADSRKSAALNMSDEKAFSEPFRSMVNSYLDQNQVAEELKESIGQRIISSTNSERPYLAKFHISKRYWEIVETKNSQGEYNTTLRCFSLGSVPKQEYEQAKLQLNKKLNAHSQIKNLLNEIGKKQIEQSQINTTQQRIISTIPFSTNLNNQSNEE